MIYSKTKLSLVFLGLFFLAPFIYPQSTPESSSALKKVYHNYFESNREEVFLHLNKTQVIKGEDIWFSANVFTPHTGKPSSQTANLHVNLYDEQGRLLQAKTVFIENGKGEGYFNLKDENYPPGFYLIKGFTKYQQNFQEDLSFRQGFRILGTESDTQEKPNEFDLQLLPEGGHLLANVFNKIGVKLIDDKGKSRTFSEANLTNAKGDTISQFKSNRFGLAKFNLYYFPDETYQLKLKPEGGDWITKTLQKPDLIGLTLSVQDITQKMLHLFLSTNEPSLKEIGGKEFHIAFHQQGKMKTSSFKFPKRDTLVTIQTPKEGLATGVNIITIFDDEFNPLLERQFFYGENLKKINLEHKLIKVKKDSLEFELRTLDKHKDFNISMTVLPENTVSYNPKHNILSAFHLKPYLKGSLEDGGYYFSDLQNPKVLEDLDLLLLTQGWSRYEWINIFKGKSKELYENEVGFTLKGQLNNRPRNINQLAIVSKNGMQFLELDEKSKFEGRHLFLEDDSEISIGIMKGNKNRMVKPKLSISQFPLRDTKNTQTLSSDFFSLKHSVPKSIRTYEFSAFSAFGEVLDSVLLEAEVAPKEFDYNSNKLFTNRTIVDEKMGQRYQYITDYIRTKGFYIDRNYGRLRITNSRAIGTKNGTPTIQLDNMVLNGPEGSLDILLNIKTADVKAITINKSGIGLGLHTGAGYIQIFTKDNVGSDTGDAPSNMHHYKMKNGFAKNKQFYTPLYLNYNDEIFNRYGAIGWFNHIDFPEGENKIRLRTERVNTSGQKLFIEGMAEDGSLISEVLLLNP